MIYLVDFALLSLLITEQKMFGAGNYLGLSALYITPKNSINIKIGKKNLEVNFNNFSLKIYICKILSMEHPGFNAVDIERTCLPLI